MGIIKRIKNKIYDVKEGEEYKNIDILTVPTLPPQYKYEIVGSINFRSAADYGIFGQGTSEHFTDLKKYAFSLGADAVIALNITYLGNYGSKSHLLICGTAIKILVDEEQE